MTLRTVLVRASCAALFVAAAVAADTPPTTPTPPADPAVATGAIEVHAAGDRDAATGLGLPLAGARLGAFADATPDEPAGECTTDATGTCTITGLAAGTYHVKPIGDPPGGLFRRIEAVTTTFGGDGPYRDTVSVDTETTVTRTFVFARRAPELGPACSTRAALVYDVSGSIDPDETAAMKAASLAFVDALAGTPSHIGITSFATSAPAAGNVDLAPTSMASASGIATVQAAITALQGTQGDDRYTNWDAALRAVTGRADLVVLFTDGSPTVHGVPAVFPPVVTGLDQLDAGVLSANAVKAAGARVIAVGVGEPDDVSATNLAAVSGPVVGADYAITTFANVGAVFRRLADTVCAPGTPATEAPPAPEPVPTVPRFTG